MKKAIILVVASCGVGFYAGYLVVGNQLLKEHKAEMAKLQAAWEAEKASLEGRLSRLSAQAARAAGGSEPRTAATPATASEKPVVVSMAAGMQSPDEILTRLKALQLQGATPQSKREMIRLLDDLVRSGAAALPAIANFLASNSDIGVAPQGKGKGGPGGQFRGSLRSELFKVVQEIGGEQAEQLLAGQLRGATSRDELVALAESLEAMAPGKYREATIASAQAMLNSMAGTDAQGKGAKQLYDILAMYGDKSYVEQAMGQLVQAGGRLNKDALDYLQTVLGQESLPLLQQLMQNPQITDAKSREEVVKMSAGLAGTSQEANRFWFDLVSNPNLDAQARQKAIAELDKRGFQNKNEPTPADLQLAQARLQLLDGLRNQLQDAGLVQTLDQARARLAVMIDPSLRPALQPAPKGKKVN